MSDELARYNARVARGARDSALFMYGEWGNEVVANLGGSTATARGTDPARFSSAAAFAQPEPLLPATQNGPIAGSATGGATGGVVISNTWFPGSVTPDNVAREVGDVIGQVRKQIDPTTQTGYDVWRSAGFILLGLIVIAIGLYAIVK